MSQRTTWNGDTPYNVLDRNLKWLGLTMLISALFDVVMVVLILVFSQSIVSVLRLESDVEVLSLQNMALSHMILPCFCMLAWMDTKRNIVVVTGAIGARVLYVLYLSTWVVIKGYSYGWMVLAGVGLMFAVAHYVLLRMSDFGFWEVLIRAGNPPGMRKR